ncbi:MAG: flagellar hook-associated protein FlgK [Thermoanaerobacteraceae bacterium]|nr:flagellar hook-associated protein FlgK [Thermoanaerobacteraceae bacterium]
MSSIFYGFEIAKSGLFAAQKALDVISNNVANANTPGYTRQRVELSAKAPPTMLGMNDMYGQGKIGAGVDVTGINQIRDVFLDVQYRIENSVYGEWDAKAQVLNSLEAIFNEPSDSGIATVIGQFFDAWEELSKNPESLSTRALVRERGVAVVQTIRTTYTKLVDKREEINQNIVTRIGEINSYAKRIAELNNQIYKFELNGDKANDLRDERNLLLDKLSNLVNINSYEDSKGRMRVDIGGQALVDHTSYYEIEAKADPLDMNMVHPVWKDTGTAVNIKSGMLKGMLDARDGSGDPEYKGVKYYIDEWNKFAKEFIDEVNAIHTAGYGLGTAGTDHLFFEGTGAVDMDISDDIKNNLNNIAAASASGLPGDNSKALEMIALRSNTSIFSEGSFEDFTRSLVSNLGVDTQQAERMTTNQSVLTQQIDNNRQSISGVSLDEEMTNMVKFQHSYNAAARMITAIDEMIDTIVNKMGIVGR